MADRQNPPAPAQNRARGWCRAGLAALAGQALLLGAPAALAPRWFTDWFPFDRGWVAASGPYNQHSISDFGYAYLGLAVVLLWATMRPERGLSLAAAAGATVTNIPHLVFHAGHTGYLPTGDDIAQAGLLALSVIVGLAVLLALYRYPEAAGPAH